MGKLIATTQATLDGVIDPVGEWVEPGGDHAKYSFERQAKSGDLPWNATLLQGALEDSIPKLKDEVDGDLFMHGSGEFAHAMAEKGLIDVYEIYVNPLVWGEGGLHVLGDRGTVRMRLEDVKRFDSGVVLLTYSPAS
jgi:dihydrofolate reductase